MHVVASLHCSLQSPVNQGTLGQLGNVTYRPARNLASAFRSSTMLWICRSAIDVTWRLLQPWRFWHPGLPAKIRFWSSSSLEPGFVVWTVESHHQSIFCKTGAPFVFWSLGRQWGSFKWHSHGWISVWIAPNTMIGFDYLWRHFTQHKTQCAGRQPVKWANHVAQTQQSQIPCGPINSFNSRLEKSYLRKNRIWIKFACSLTEGSEFEQEVSGQYSILVLWKSVF